MPAEAQLGPWRSKPQAWLTGKGSLCLPSSPLDGTQGAVTGGLTQDTGGARRMQSFLCTRPHGR